MRASAGSEKVQADEEEEEVALKLAAAGEFHASAAVAGELTGNSARSDEGEATGAGEAKANAAPAAAAVVAAAGVVAGG